ncbi:MAG: bifunctional 4-hydroxy-3-methylbut-2-enyl diphosphate reductase/30S ribosomal protein S1 [Eubacteriales bacterium]|nr:bifunctional 4-hydroxy-3-methylbut-2-enyl diphosphate reductase/30S ribosomal protein S1 [Bacillota bacterium]MBV1727817.1 bifunctional 4-hydroxy-3-methylbut-2-enyl diphosphate reductase/30S ribosomal protein S1 [Desulforudis sp.]MDQ7788439.1 bifunctional 4-hydroxy-3-methylbut-2-enyl diphosphate reductase/30S ribosomal protein S1 [Clostridia bacterium]MDZ4042129.1 bifunctional 4-hydroxy-3-methylbut-2-enyl diphosphate reductase/30S ribosomal protein S1 [Eubacteriales bacterium]MBU4532426.1 bi
MEVRVAAKAGFCFGVRRAIDLATKTAGEDRGPIYSLGPLIHNPQVVELLTREGINVIDAIEGVELGTIIIRSHGVGPDLLEAVHNSGFTVVDATCPFVQRAQILAHDLTADGYNVVVVGDRKHPEVKGIVGWTNGQALVVEDPVEASQLPRFDKVGVVAQTTQPHSNFEAVVEVLKSGTGEVAVSNTICNAVVERQKAALDLAREVEIMVVVGGAESANTQKLTKLCQQTGTPTYHIETSSQLDPEWFRGLRVAGLTAGASTPDWIIEEVERRMSEMEETTNQEEMVNQEETVTPEEAVETSPEEAVVEEKEVASEETTVDEETTSDEQELQQTQVRSLHSGDVIRGVVVQINQDEVLVDVGAKSEGVISQRELSCCDVNNPTEIVQVGDEIDVWVVKAEDNEGRIILSKNRADAVKSWELLDEAFKDEQPVSGKVREVVKGGLLVDLGVRAFMPASQVERGFVEDLSQYVGLEISAKIIELNRGRKKVILSRRALLEAEYAGKRTETLATIQEGETVKGFVRRLTQFGTFVDIGGVDGLLHISEISWHRISHPSEALKVGDEIEVLILRVDREHEKVSLSLKQMLPNPWDNIGDRYPVDDIVPAKVVRLVPFGAFVELEPGVEGLVHISHLANHHVAKPEDVIQEGQEINVKVLSIDQEGKRIRLSLREAGPAPEPRFDKPEDSQPAEDTGNVTLGDQFGHLFEKK